MLVQKSLFSMQKPQKKAGTNRDYVLKSLIGMHKTTVKGWNQRNLFILVPSTLLYVFKSTVEVWDQYRLVSLVLKSLFFMKEKNKDEGWNPYRLVILVQITLFCMHRTTG